MIQKEFRRQLKTVGKYSVKTSGSWRPKALHRLRSAMLRLSLLLKYGSPGKGNELARRLMKCRKAMAATRDCDVCWARIREEMHAAGLSKKTGRRIRQAIDSRKCKGQWKMRRMLRARNFKGLLSEIDNFIDDPGKLDLTAIHNGNIIYQRPNDWEPRKFHQIRKRLRVINYVHDLLKEKNGSEDQQDNDNWILRYQNVLGDHIDATNTVKILRGLKNVKKHWIEGLIDREIGKMQKCHWLIKSMPWPDMVNFSRTASQESYL